MIWPFIDVALSVLGALLVALAGAPTGVAWVDECLLLCNATCSALSSVP